MSIGQCCERSNQCTFQSEREFRRGSTIGGDSSQQKQTFFTIATPKVAESGEVQLPRRGYGTQKRTEFVTSPAQFTDIQTGATERGSDGGLVEDRARHGFDPKSGDRRVGAVG
ncbi:MAG: hypothetical protein EB037_06775 [Actinobacteria bacterium]|nr:hypothetical protein [Actinomycetota bacterium]